MNRSDDVLGRWAGVMLNADVYAEVIKRMPGDAAPGQSVVLINQYTGVVARVDDIRTAPAGTRALALNRALHFGDVYGWPSRVVAALASFCLILQSLTGFMIWLARQKRKPKSTPSRLRVPEQVA